MEKQKNKDNPILLNTSRNFYSRRIVQRTNSNAQLQKIFKLLTHQNQKKTYSRIKTQPKQQYCQPLNGQIDNILKMAKVKLEHLINKHRNEWKQLYELFDQYKRSNSIQTMKINQANLLLKMQEMMKNQLKSSETSTDRHRSKQYNKHQQGKISLENIKLYKENQILKQQLDNFQEQKQRNIVTTKSIKSFRTNTFQEMYQPLKRISEDQYNQIIRETQFLKQSNNQLRQQKKALIEMINETKAKNQNLCEQILKQRNSSNNYLHKFQKWKNIMSMQNEQIISLKRDVVDIKKQFSDLHRRYQNTLTRISKLNSNNQYKLNQITTKSVQIFSQQIQSFQRIRNIFIMKNYYHSIANQKEQKQNNAPYKKYLSEKDTLNNSQGIKKMGKDYYKFYKPSFFIYLEKYFQYQGVDKQNFQHISINVGMIFLTTIRAILDSKHNQYLLAKNISKQFTSLSAFTISWLSNYKIDSKTRKIEQINSDVCFETIGSFYARLMNNQLNGNWEIITFRQFLLQSLTLDQLSFYLKVRFKLFKGDSLSRSGQFMEIYYINYLDALLIIQEIVTDFDYRKKLEQYIKRSVQFQRKKQLIDAHFILRLLLQYYQYYKNKMFLTLSKTFSTYTKQKNTNMPFQSYLKIYDYNFFEINLVQKVQIYQKAFSLGKGVVNLQNIFTVLNQQAFLCAQVEKMFAKNMIYQQKEEQVVYQKHPSQQINIFQQYFQNLCQNTLSKQTTNLGLQRVRLQLDQLRINKNLTYESLFNRFQFIHTMSMLGLKKMFHSKKTKEAQVIAMIPRLIKFYQQLVKSTLQRNQILNILDDFKKKAAAKAIFRFYRKKKGFFIRSYLPTIQNFDKYNIKTDQIRKQFTSLIDNIKKKYNNQTHQQTINQYQQLQ